MAAPLAPIEPEDISGTIGWWVWRDTTEIKRKEMGSEVTIRYPAHYLIVLNNVKKIEEEKLKKISNYSKLGYFPDDIMYGSLDNDSVLIYLPSVYREDITSFMKMTLINYGFLISDESGPNVICDSIKIEII